MNKIEDAFLYAAAVALAVVLWMTGGILLTVERMGKELKNR